MRRAATGALATLLAVGLTATPAFATAPDAPTQPTLAAGNGQIVVTFGAPASDGGAAINNYTATCTSGDGGATGSNSNGGAVAPITVAGLTNLKTYTCTVTAGNADGTSIASPVSAPVAVGSVPGAPAAPSVSRGNASIVVTFLPPADNGGSAITIYTASCSTGGAPVIEIGVSPIIVTGLANGSTYTCTVAATNGTGTGPPSPSSAAVTPATVPNAPAAPTVAQGNAQLVVTVTPLGNNGSAITSFGAACTSSDGGIGGSDTGASPITVAGLTNGKTYTCTATATNAIGTSAPSAASATAVPAAVPGAPSQPGVTPGNGQAVVTWSPPSSDGGSAITGYTATCTSSNGGATGTQTGFSPLTVSGLTNGSTYTCAVAATNIAGTGPAGPASGSVVPAGAPAAPTQPTVAAASNQLTVTFAAPSANGSAITSYTASCTSTDGGAPGAIAGTASPLTVVTLTNGSTYTCTVSATNAIGTSTPSAASAPAVPAAVPTAPAVPTVVAGSGQIVVSFTPPASNGGNAITGYSASCTSSNGGAAGSNTGPASPITVAGLNNGSTYTCTVTATNGIGASAPSGASAPATPTGAPDSPAAPTVTRGNAQIVVTFTPPFNNGSAISSYNASCTSSDSGAAGAIAGNASPITVTGLTNGKTYTCTVSATNGVGSSAPSIASAPIVVGVPNAPAAPTVAPGSSQIIVTFTTPAANGSAITGYAASCLSGDGGTPGTATGATSPITVTGVSDGKTYTCRVTATNGVGTGPQSPDSASVVPNPVPDAPTKPTVASGSGQITVTFVAPIDHGNAITNYTARCTSTEGGAAGSEDGTASPLVVTGLTNGKAYTCTVTATNVIGTGAASIASAEVVPAAAPAAPEVDLADSGNNALNVSFTPGNNNGAAVMLFTVTCISSNGGITGTATGSESPIAVTGLTNGNLYTCKLTATNTVGTSPSSAASNAVIVGAPAAPTVLAVIPGSSQGKKGALKVAFHAGAANAGTITQYRATCTPVSTGLTVVGVGTGSPISVRSLLAGHAYECSVVATNFFGTSAESNTLLSQVGTPGAPRVVKVMRLPHGLAMAYLPAQANGSPITNYRARCTSSNGGVSSSPLQLASPIVASRLTAGKTYICKVTAINARGESPPTTVGPYVAALPDSASLNMASCSGRSGNLRVSPGLLLDVNKPHTLRLSAKFGKCSGPYVKAAKLALTFRSKTPFSCKTAIDKPSAGSGSITWTAPAGLGNSRAAIQLVITSSNAHVTKARFKGTITSRANVFTDQHVSGTVTLTRGLGSVVSGGNCSNETRLQKLVVSSISMTVS